MGNGEIPNTKAKGLRSERAHAPGRPLVFTHGKAAEPASVSSARFHQLGT